MNEHQSKHLNNKDKLDGSSANAMIAPNETAIPELNKTEADREGLDENHISLYEHNPTKSHDMIDDDQEPGISDNETASNSSTTLYNNKHYANENDKNDQFENDSLKNNDLLLAQEAIGMQDEQNAMDDANDQYNEKTDIDSELGVESPETSSEEDQNEENSEGLGSDSNHDQTPPISDEESVDPSAELLDEEGIDNVGKFGKKRDKVFHGKEKNESMP